MKHPLSLVQPAAHARALELAHGALCGMEALTLSVAHGLEVPADRVVGFQEAIAVAKRELAAIANGEWPEMADATERLH